VDNRVKLEILIYLASFNYEYGVNDGVSPLHGATLFPEKAGPAVVGFVVATRAIVGQTFLNHRGKG